MLIQEIALDRGIKVGLRASLEFPSMLQRVMNHFRRFGLNKGLFIFVDGMGVFTKSSEPLDQVKIPDLVKLGIIPKIIHA